jgi:hypothetical protein
MNSIPLHHEPADPLPFRRPSPDIEDLLLDSDERSKSPMGFVGTCDSMMSDFESLYDGIETIAPTINPSKRASVIRRRMNEQPHPWA